MTEDARAFTKELSQMECRWVRALSEHSFLSFEEESILRWALSLARVSRVFMPQPVEIGHATDIYREKLYGILKPCANPGQLQKSIAEIYPILKDEQQELLTLYGTRLSAKALEKAIERRPLALALGGGGGTSFVFTGAFEALEQAGIIPQAIAGSSMGAILGLYRARSKHFVLDELKQMASPTLWERMTQNDEQGSRFGLPASFRLNLRNAFADQFQKDDRMMYLGELEIPFRVTVTGISDSDVQKLPELSWPEAGNMQAASIRKQERSIIQSLMAIANKPLKAIYLGGDELTKEFDVLDAVGFSAAVPGLFQYDVLRHDPHMVPLIRELMHQHGVTRFIDGGLSDNLPAAEAARCLTDPFVLALDAFSPNWKRHWLFLPLMRIAADTSREGYKAAHLTIAYQRVLSPINVVPSALELARAIENGKEETAAHIPFIQKMLGPIPNPFKT